MSAEARRTEAAAPAANALRWRVQEGPRHNLPAALSSLIGREGEVAEIGLRGARQPAWLDRLALEHDNFRHALRGLLAEATTAEPPEPTPTMPAPTSPATAAPAAFRVYLPCAEH